MTESGWYCYDKDGNEISGPWNTKAQAQDWEYGYGWEKERPISFKKVK